MDLHEGAAEYVVLSEHGLRVEGNGGEVVDLAILISYCCIRVLLVITVAKATCIVWRVSKGRGSMRRDKYEIEREMVTFTLQLNTSGQHGGKHQYHKTSPSHSQSSQC